MIQWLKEIPSVPFCFSWFLLLYDILLMEMFDYELALMFNFDLLLTQEVCRFIQNSKIVNNVFIQHFFPLLKMYVACSR